MSNPEKSLWDIEQEALERLIDAAGEIVMGEVVDHVD